MTGLVGPDVDDPALVGMGTSARKRGAGLAEKALRHKKQTLKPRSAQGPVYHLGMTLHTRLISDLIFPLQERLKKHTTVRVKREMEASQYWPIDKLEALRVGRLRSLLTHAGQHVPYYRDLFGRLGFDPRAVSSCAGCTMRSK